MQIIYRVSKLWQLSACSAFLKYIQVLFQAENSITGRGYMVEVLIQVWLKNLNEWVIGEQSECIKENLKNSRGSRT